MSGWERAFNASPTLAPSSLCACAETHEGPFRGDSMGSTGFRAEQRRVATSRTTHACLAPKCLFWAPQPPRPNPSTARVGFPRDDRCRECGWWSRLWLGCGQYCVPCTTDLEHFLYYRHLSIQTSYLVQNFILHPTRQHFASYSSIYLGCNLISALRYNCVMRRHFPRLPLIKSPPRCLGLVRLLHISSFWFLFSASTQNSRVHHSNIIIISQIA